MYYTCAQGDEGITLQLSTDRAGSTQGIVREPFDPPLYDKAKERVTKSHYFVKDFQPLRLGPLELLPGRSHLQLRALEIPGHRAIDVHSVDLQLRSDAK